jgi:hypothetical protein
MDIGAETRVVSEVPAWIVGIFVDDNVIRVPEPGVCVSEIVRSDAPVPVIEPEAVRAAADEAPTMCGTEAAIPMAMFPRVIEVVVRVVGAVVVTDPASAIDMRLVGMANLVGEVVIVFSPGRSVVGLRAMRRGSVHLMSAAAGMTSFRVTSAGMLG